MLLPPASLITPIADADNATIEFQSQTGVTTDLNGFPIITSTTVSLRARLYNESAKAGDIFPDGADLQGELLWGRLHNPVSFPPGITNLSVVNVVFDDGRSGTARIRVKTQNSQLGDAPSIGQKFHLLFRRES
jgi:hypothetical protein